MRLLFVLLFSASLFAGEWTINDFTIRGKQFTQSATGILLGNLNRIPSYRAPKGDELLLRRRLDMNNYGLYVGKAEASAYTNLSRFTKPAGMSMDKLLKMKFFKDETPTGYNDVADIYFQGEYIYVKNLVRIFYKENGSWKSLEVAQGAKPGVLEISSTPRGATVTIDGVVKGKTPYSFVMDAPTVEVEVSKGGYYSQSFTADAKPGAVKKFASSLKKRVTFSSNVEPEKMLDTTIQDIDQALELLRSIEGVYKKEKGRESTALAEFEKSFPKLKPQGEFEYDHEFAKRKAEYDVKKQKALTEAKVNASAFQFTISQMNEHIDQLSAKLYDLYLPVNSMKLGRYEINENRFPVTLSINQGAFQFTYTGYLIMNRDVAKLFKFSSDEKGLKLQYSKRKVKVAGKDYYIRYGGMNIPFQGKVYELSGGLTLPIEIVNSRAYKDYEGQIAYRKDQEKVIKNSQQFFERKIKNGDLFAAQLFGLLNLEKARGDIQPKTWLYWKNYLGSSLSENKHYYYEHYVALFSDASYEGSHNRARTLFNQCVKQYNDPLSMAFLSTIYHNGYGVTPDFTKAHDWAKKSADLGNSTGMFGLGALYEKGLIGSSKDYKLAYSWYLRASEFGNFYGMNSLGSFHRFGLGVEVNLYQAEKWYKKSANLGNQVAMVNLGSLYLGNDGFDKDYKKAFEWFSKAAELGNTAAMLGLGLLYKKGYYVNKDLRKTLKWYSKSADAGNLNGMNRLGYLYQNGEGVARNYNNAFMWFKKSADLGSALGMSNVAYFYSKGYGVEKDYQKAIEWYTKSADLKNAYSMYSLGWIYQQGNGVRKDIDKAIEWYEKSAQFNYGPAMTALGNMYRLGTGVRKDNNHALEWYKKGAAKKDANAMYFIGYMYSQGLGVEKNNYTAFDWYQKSADLNSSSAMYNLGFNYEYGTGASKNWQEAKKWYVKAAKLGNKSAIKKCNEKGISF